ncbi:MAG TPA: hypothetical protein V6D16_22240 [Candidatus Obscuribacterales bacterium]
MANPSLEGTCPQTPAEGRLRPPDPLQTNLTVDLSALIYWTLSQPITCSTVNCNSAANAGTGRRFSGRDTSRSLSTSKDCGCCLGV